MKSRNFTTFLPEFHIGPPGTLFAGHGGFSKASLCVFTFQNLHRSSKPFNANLQSLTSAKSAASDARSPADAGAAGLRSASCLMESYSSLVPDSRNAPTICIEGNRQHIDLQ